MRAKCKLSLCLVPPLAHKASKCNQQTPPPPTPMSWRGIRLMSITTSQICLPLCFTSQLQIKPLLATSDLPLPSHPLLQTIPSLPHLWVQDILLGPGIASLIHLCPPEAMLHCSILPLLQTGRHTSWTMDFLPALSSTICVPFPLLLLTWVLHWLSPDLQELQASALPLKKHSTFHGLSSVYPVLCILPTVMPHPGDSGSEYQSPSQTPRPLLP
jgi:hypothetical protein